MSTNTDLNKKPDQNGHRNGDTKAIGDAKLSQKNPPSQAPTSPSSRSSSDKLDAPQTPRDELRLISKYKSSSRRGSSTFLTSDDNIIMAFGSSRRLSSFCTTSSYEYFNFEFLEFTRDTALSIADEPFTEEEISETIRAHKQIIASMKQQNWPMYRKLKILNRAKHYINKHEGELKQSKQAKDLFAKYKVYMERT
ncbi:hypothetical protein QR98_0068400 [Sarcoptes scabiei]|uniref:Uncharacterized protein n=1 Tax=Sarcoptes scabiei TaxID=52283 RepID=A0A132ABG3_SARSC|nr:hypothetical protein QR98_0068400 [Sarcoptes scabiei]